MVYLSMHLFESIAEERWGCQDNRLKLDAAWIIYFPYYFPFNVEVVSVV